jgi:hypothetical protein
MTVRQICDFTKKVIPEDQEVVTATIGDKEYTFSQEGWKAMLDFLDGVDAMISSATFSGATLDVNRTLLPDDAKPLPSPSKKARMAVLNESRKSPPGSLEALSKGRREAEKKLRMMNTPHETLDEATKKRLGL